MIPEKVIPMHSGQCFEQVKNRQEQASNPLHPGMDLTCNIKKGSLTLAEARYKTDKVMQGRDESTKGNSKGKRITKHTNSKVKIISEN